MLTALSVVREKELGSIINFYVTPVTRLEFLLGKQLPYIVLAMLNFLLLVLLAVTLFGVPLKGSFFDADAGDAALRRCHHGHGSVDLDLHAQPDRRHLRHSVVHHAAGGAVLRVDRSGFIAGGGRAR